MVAPNDPEIVRRQYATGESLRIRQEIHNTYTVPKQNFVEWVVNVIPWCGDERVLDAGCGVGTYYEALTQDWPEIDYYGLDISTGMLATHPSNGRNGVGDVQQLPFAEATFDVVMANHMLFYVQDIDAAIQEFRRVLKPGGVYRRSSPEEIINCRQMRVN